MSNELMPLSEIEFDARKPALTDGDIDSLLATARQAHALREENARLINLFEAHEECSHADAQAMEHMAADNAALRAVVEAQGFHAPRKHYWYRGLLVDAPQGTHGEPCRKCCAALAAREGKTG